MEQSPAMINVRPRFKLNTELRDEMSEAALEVVIQNPLSGQAHAEVRLLNWGPGANGDSEPDFRFDDVHLGDALEVILGQTTDEASFKGEITALEERYGDGAPQLVILMEDSLHRLARQRHNRSFEDQTLDDVISQIASEAGLQSDVEASDINTSWHQMNESNLAFLLRQLCPFTIAIRIQDNTLRVKYEEQDDNPYPLNGQNSVNSLRIIADLNHQPVNVLSQGYDSGQDERVEAEQSTLIPPSTPPSQGATAADVLQELGWEGEELSPQPFAYTQEMANRYAQGNFLKQARRFLHGDVVCDGIPDMHSGREIELEGVSPRLQGRYLVEHCTHRFDNQSGFQTHMKISRPDWGAS